MHDFVRFLSMLPCSVSRPLHDAEGIHPFMSINSLYRVIYIIRLTSCFETFLSAKEGSPDAQPAKDV